MKQNKQQFQLQKGICRWVEMGWTCMACLSRALSLSVRQSCHLLSSSFSGTRVFLVHGRTPQRNMHVCMCSYKLAHFSRLYFFWKFWGLLILATVCVVLLHNWSARPRLRWNLSPKSDFGLSRLFYNPMNLEGLNQPLNFSSCISPSAESASSDTILHLCPLVCLEPSLLISLLLIIQLQWYEGIESIDKSSQDPILYSM